MAPHPAPLNAAPLKAIFEGLEPLIAALEPHPVYAIGGIVRAFLRHDPLTGLDTDLTTPATPAQVQAACIACKIPVTTPGIRWGTVNLHLPEKMLEITTFRQEAYLAGSRYPTVNFTESLETDAQRRDFTINAIYLSPDGTLTDPFGGAEDLRHGIVKFIGNPAQRLREDPLRLLRFFRFCGHYGLGGLTPELAEVLVQSAPALHNLSRTRVQTEWQKLQKTPQAATVIAELQRLNITPYIQSRM